MLYLIDDERDSDRLCDLRDVSPQSIYDTRRCIECRVMQSTLLSVTSYPPDTPAVALLSLLYRRFIAALSLPGTRPPFPSLRALTIPDKRVSREREIEEINIERFHSPITRPYRIFLCPRQSYFLAFPSLSAIPTGWQSSVKRINGVIIDYRRFSLFHRERATRSSNAGSSAGKDFYNESAGHLR